MDLAAVVVFRPGGTGAFYELHALVGRDGRPQDAGSALLGDRIRVESLSIDNARITVRLLDRRDDESYAAVPSVIFIRRFELLDGALAEIPSP